MGFLPQFENDIFLSYRRVSNASTDQWIDSFEKNLQDQLNELLVGKVKIWRDRDALCVGDEWRKKIAEALESTAVFMAVINRTYFASPECIKELDRFLGHFKTAGDGRKLVPVYKQPTAPGSNVPRELREINHHEFYLPRESGWHELDPKRDPGDYNERMSRMVQDLVLALEALRGEQTRQSRGKVFLSHVGPELQQDRESLRGDLLQHGFAVVPENEPWWNSDDCEQRMLDDMAGSLLCVHLVMRAASVEPATPNNDRRQLDLAHRVTQERGMQPPLVWIRSASETAPANKPLLEHIEHTLGNEGVQILRGSLAELTSEMFDLLPQPAPDEAAGADAAGSGTALQADARDVALLVEERELKEMKSLRLFLAETLGIDSRPIKFTGPAPKDEQRMLSDLARCSHVVVFWSGQDEAWVKQLLEHPALTGHLRDKRVCVYIAGESTDEKDGFVSAKAVSLEAPPGGVEADGLRDFLGPSVGVAA